VIVSPPLGATDLGDGRCQFVVWAPRVQHLVVHLVAPQERDIALSPTVRGYHHAIVEGIEPGALYTYRLKAHTERPDPASRCQPQGVHGPSQIVPQAFPWTDHDWHGLALQDYILYELHVGTFTPDGTFDAILPYLDELHELGVTAIELMPVAQFPGERNWGYDGVFPYAVQYSYGGSAGLKRLVDACHQRRLAVVLDVVYNHLGPEGNYLANFAPYFTDHYKTPWGQALNFDGAHSDEVRRYFIENALYWITDCHIDALRLDAVHAIVDQSAYPFLAELADQVHHRAARLNRKVHLIAESNLNDSRLIRSSELGGCGLDAQWNDDFHHALHTLLTGEREGYYDDFGRLSQLARAFREGYVYAGQYSAYRQRRHGNSSRQVAAHQLVVCAQNHDQIGNRLLGDRLAQLTSFAGLKLAAGVVLLSPFIPLLFMGEAYGETAPFPYFVSHSDPQLIEAVRRGRREEFAAFAWQGDTPDPQSAALFEDAKLRHHLRHDGCHAVLYTFYKTLIQLRKTRPALMALHKESMTVHEFERQQVLCVRRWTDDDDVFMCFNFSETATSMALPLPAGGWQNELDSAVQQWHGPGSNVPDRLSADEPVTLSLAPQSVLLFTRITDA
jgi:maltooligosyltrehalose trehalohydrolase